MQYGDFIACITESLIHHEMEDGKTYAEACNDVEDFLTDWIIVGEERVREKLLTMEKKGNKIALLLIILNNIVVLSMIERLVVWLVFFIVQSIKLSSKIRVKLDDFATNYKNFTYLSPIFVYKFQKLHITCTILCSKKSENFFKKLLIVIKHCVIMLIKMKERRYLWQKKYEKI